MDGPLCKRIMLQGIKGMSKPSYRKLNGMETWPAEPRDLNLIEACWGDVRRGWPRYGDEQRMLKP